MSAPENTATLTAASQQQSRPWPALWALVVGFFMILVDTTIVSVATPTIISELNAGVSEAIWVSSAYLLAYAVPLLIMGRMGDRYGPKKIYLIGLVIFTLSSLACGLVGSVNPLIIARVVQGIGAAMMTPQTMATITRLFPANERGKAMAIWGAVAGIATLVGPVLGGLLLDSLGWEWIFFINVPVGVVGFFAVVKYVPRMEVNKHRFDWIGVALSAVGLFCIVFGLQEADTFEWGQIWGPITVWSLIIFGLVVLVGFVLWQKYNRSEPLLPLELFSDRNFAVSNIAIVTVGFSVTAMPFALMIWAQAARGFSPTEAALLSAPTALMSLVLARPVGNLVDRIHPRLLATIGCGLWSAALFGLVAVMNTTSPVWLILIPMTVLGISNSFVWGPLSTAATGNLPPLRAGAGSGVYNTARQVGAVMGSAVIATLISSRIAANLGTSGQGFSPASMGSADIPEPVREGLANAMSQAVLVPAIVIGVAVIIVQFYKRPSHQKV
ncbi:DHA2 family efflux MFS transporter permease subunit [Tessaracoccus antarcticus]|uniref:DHA2 family efflux MFS transporter permease subunit n=1 Tax=Tessaracoccus antarcticus TaxID=2479848 RepID=A0A3M0GFH1_9ACTN|nr:DHA2 family efflux MFS transporter permease subunit [Tessaracoccus antarcticus]RMB61432.1 DHA2 family efflux MFS transporter permease subunit [Tessaracoccus antarcticus]